MPFDFAEATGSRLRVVHSFLLMDTSSGIIPYVTAVLRQPPVMLKCGEILIGVEMK